MAESPKDWVAPAFNEWAGPHLGRPQRTNQFPPGQRPTKIGIAGGGNRLGHDPWADRTARCSIGAYVAQRRPSARKGGFFFYSLYNNLKALYMRKIIPKPQPRR